MFRELVELARCLEQEGKLPPFGFYNYVEPIRWVVHFWPDAPARVHLESSEMARSRPFDGRTSAVRAHPMADEAAYALGVNRQRRGSADEKADEKHRSFMGLLLRLLESRHIRDGALREAISCVKRISGQGSARTDKRWDEIAAKDWISFMPEEGTLAGMHLFEHPEVKAFWKEEILLRTGLKDTRGRSIEAECAVCGASRPAIGRMPKVKLNTTIPLHSLNADAFVSFMEGSGVFKKAHIGLCLECAESAAQAFNYLSNTPLHHREILRDEKKRDSPCNHVALFWVKSSGIIEVGESTIRTEQLLAIITSVIGEAERQNDATPPSDIQQIAAALDSPWTAKEAALCLDEDAFYLAVLSPNVGRITLREWIAVPLGTVRMHLKDFLGALKIMQPSGGQPHPVTIHALLAAINSTNPNIERALLRTAYTGTPPPFGLLENAVQRFRVPDKPSQSNEEERRQALRRMALAAAMKLVLTHRGKEAETMEQLDEKRRTPPYLSGRLLAILEEIQLRHSNWKLNTTLVDRFYGAASTAPASVFGNLVKRATTDHLPKLRKEQRGHQEAEELLEGVLADIDNASGFPRTLNTREQAEFALGFYHQRAQLRRERPWTKAG